VLVVGQDGDHEGALLDVIGELSHVVAGDLDTGCLYLVEVELQAGIARIKRKASKARVCKKPLDLCIRSIDMVMSLPR